MKDTKKNRSDYIPVAIVGIGTLWIVAALTIGYLNYVIPSIP